MPELPELTALAAWLDGQLAGATVASLQFPTAFALKNKDVSPDIVAGRTLIRVVRRGKFLVFDTDPDGGGPALVANFGKSGWVRVSGKLPEVKDAPEAVSAAKPAAGPIMARIGLVKDGTEHGVDLMDYGRWKGLAVHIVHDPEVVPGIAELGPEALDPEFTLEDFARLLTSKQRIKDIIRDQKKIAGIGNGYSDEILHAAKLSPLAPGASLDTGSVERLYTAMRQVLSDAAGELTGLAPDKLKAAKKASMAVHGRNGEDCPVCGDTIQELAYVGTSFQYCPGCQTGGQVLAR
ncbi:hypothetical protein BIU82_17240 [Arthrobacter sp. SW1]|uniref:DNA-formamidopyrimidine glycosylase family protein n=1 Tax=Arthrobacter sp. SW1 TaxID=1920889 RepID=UPI000877D9FB|nr:DNA-formamidopyrimidine glycosylase family protein [Arthrobacter sp. SW1]OFI38808.1 hypothetical protein BIU82_17240 [Arthrobacter sp. SW1]